MTTFARIVNGFAIDCRVHASATELAACFHPVWLAQNPFVVVPDGTVHGARDNGNGTFTNPIVIPPPPVYRRLTRQDLRAVAKKAFGDNGAAVAKLQTYLDTAKANVGTTAADKVMRYAYDSIMTGDDFSFDDGDQIMTGLQFTAPDKAAVQALWPQVP